MSNKPLQCKIRTSTQSQSHQYSISIQFTLAPELWLWRADQIRRGGGGGGGVVGNDDHSDPEMSGSGHKKKFLSALRVSV